MVQLNATARTAMGSKNSKTMRAHGKIPGIIYGHGQTPQAVALDMHEVQQAVSHGERLLEVSLDGGMQNVLIKELQYDAMGSDILHIDLARVNLDELVEVTVPILLRGTPVGATEGGVLQQIAAEVSIQVQVRSIPDDIRIAVNEMKVGDKLFAKDLPLPEGSKLIDDAEMLVATVSLVIEKEPEAPEEAVAAPEVIGEKEEEEAPAEGAVPEKAEKPEKPEKKEK